MPSLPVKANQCPNCQQNLEGENFCPKCGQKNDVRRITFWHFISESLSNFFAFDGRFFHTTRYLLTAPGKVPKDFLSGKRMRYLHPIRVYFISSLILLFIMQPKDPGENIIDVKETENKGAINFSQKEKGEAPFKLLLTPEDSTAIDDSTVIEESSSQSDYVRMKTFASENPTATPVEALQSLEIENSFWNRFLYSNSRKIENFDVEAYSRYYYSKIFWVLFFFLPVLAFLLHLLYWRRNFYYPEHLFFTFYTQSVLFIALSLALIIEYIIIEGAVVFTGVLFAGYLLMAMKRFYEQSWRKTIFKFFILNILSLPIFVLFFVLSALVVFVLF